MQLSDKQLLNSFDRQFAQLLGQGCEQLPHAMLLIGREGLGKAIFAENLARMLLCEAPQDNLACGECQSCRWVSGGNHPDFRHVKPDSEEEGEEGGREKTKKRGSGIIRIDQIRELESFVFVGSHRMGRRVVLLTDADTMNQAAANSLLKILEEPPVSVYFILTSSKQKFLLPTIRSRCRSVMFGVPDSASANELLAQTGLGAKAGRYLALAGGAPMRVARWKESGALVALDELIDTLIRPPADPIELAAQWDGLLKSDAAFSLELLVEELQRWIFDLAQEQMSAEPHYHAGWNKPNPTPGMPSPLALLKTWHELMQFRRSARHPLNQMLFLESLATHYLRALRPANS